MLSIREMVFETNSSSCHVLTIVRKSLAEKLRNCELFYVGPFHYSSDSDRSYVNCLQEDKIITMDEFKKKLKETAEYILGNPAKSDWIKEYASKALKYLDELTPEFMRDQPDEWGEHDWYDILDECAPDYVPAGRLLGDSNADVYPDESFEYELSDGDSILIQGLDVSC